MVPKQSAANLAKSKILPPLLPADAEYAIDGENCEQSTDVLEAKPRSNLTEKMPGLGIDAKSKHHFVDPCEGTESNIEEGVVEDASMATPAPILKLAKRNVRKPSPAQL
jgi:hypothetical protein